MSKNIIIKLTHPHKITLYRNGTTPSIYYYFTFNKKVYRGSTGIKNEQQSIDKMTEIFYEITHNLRRTGKKKTISLKYIVKPFLIKKKREGLSSKTLTEYTRQSKYLIEFFKNKDIDTFGNKKDYEDYSNWRFNYYKHHKSKKGQRKIDKLGNFSVNRECRLLVSLLRYSKEYKGYLKNIEIQPYKMLIENRRDEILTKKEYLKLKEYFLKNNPYYWNIISFVNNTGIRYPSEMNKIQWKDVNFKDSYVMIRNRKNKKQGEILNTPIPLIGRVKEIIENLKSRKNIPMDSEDFVFVNEKGVQIKNIRYRFHTSLTKCGINKKITMYQFRHLYTTRMVKRSDIPLKVVSFTLGHTDTTMLEKHYSHLKSDDVIQIFKRSEEKRQEIKLKHKELSKHMEDEKGDQVTISKKKLKELLESLIEKSE